mgnify:CR=1 FL=1
MQIAIESIVCFAVLPAATAYIIIKIRQLLAR